MNDIKNIQIEEIHTDQTFRSRSGVLLGQETYRYKSPTHWSDAICTVRVSHNPNGYSVALNWGAGGVNNDFTELQIANAMSQAFKLAARRIEILEDAAKVFEKIKEADCV